MTDALTILTTFGWCLVSGIVPVVNAELYLLSASALVRQSMILPVIVAATLGQMTAKSVMYATGRGMLRIKWPRLQQLHAKAQERFGQRNDITGTLLFVSGSTGLPPFYLVCIGAGVMRIPFVRFAILGTLGRFVRFAGVVLIPQMVKWGSH